MKLRLKSGFGSISNSKFSISPGQIIVVEDGTSFDPNVLEIVKLDEKTGFEVYNDTEEVKVIVKASFEEVKEESKEKIKDDLNNDGVFDKKDISLASKILSKGKKIKR